jgi:hypothetical protein
MKRRTRLIAIATAVGAATLLGVASSSVASADDGHVQNFIFERLIGFEEVPSISSNATATLVATINDQDQTITYKLTWKGFDSTVIQSHIHFGNTNTNGGVSVFLCGGGPQAVACPNGSDPAAEQTVTGTLTPADVIGPTAQGIAPGEFAELVRAIRGGHTYANIHTVNHPGGEIRAQIDR